MCSCTIHSLGNRGENAATEYLRSNGYVIRDRNWKTGRHEVDIIAEKGDFIVFVEVKTRSENYISTPEDAVTVPKQRSIIFVASTYIRRYKIEKECRFDVIAVVKGSGQQLKIEHIKNAFYPTK